MREPMSLVMAESEDGRTLGAFLATLTQLDEDRLDEAVCLTTVNLAACADAPALFLAFQEFARLSAEAFFASHGIRGVFVDGPRPRHLQ